MSRYVALTAVCGCGLLWLAPVEAQVTAQVDPPESPCYSRVNFAIGGVPPTAAPFDPEQIDVSILIAPPSGAELTLPAFCAQPFERRRIRQGDRDVNWMYPAGSPRWQARFTPSDRTSRSSARGSTWTS